MPLFVLEPQSALFPDPRLALDEPNGLLAVGGDLSCQRLLSAYHNGIFPWYTDSDPLMWWSPDPRAIFEPSLFRPSRSLQKTARKHNFQLWINRDFPQVIQNCASVHAKQGGTWINTNIVDAYTKLYQMGYAHSIEYWQDEQLMGGLYGINLGQIFCGESMFHHVPNASKLALWGLCSHFSRYGGALIDCQLMNSHLHSLGAKSCSRAQFLHQLINLKQRPIDSHCWDQQIIRL